jgi:hypothetical protein
VLRIRKRNVARVEMRLLLLGLTGSEPAFQAWDEWLTSAGVPFDAVTLNELTTPLQVVDDAGCPRFQGLILAEGGAMEVALEPTQRADLERVERQLGLRRLTAYVVPGPEYGLRPARWTGLMDDLEAVLTARGQEVFPYLRERLPVDPGSWAYLASPASSAQFETLVAGPGQSALLGIHRHDDGREEMVQMFNTNSSQAQGQALRRGQVAWLTGGSYVGFDRHYLSAEVDDVLMANHSWNLETHQSDRRPEHSIRMHVRDARQAADWTRARGLRLDLACNGAGSSGHPSQTGRGRDPLLAALLADGGVFGWLNHTYQHLDLDDASQAEIEAEIERNIDWAAGAGIGLEPGAVVTGAHTGLANLTATPPREENPALATALDRQRIRYIACDASRSYPAPNGGKPLPPGTPFEIGGAFAVPRHPTLLPHDAATPSQVLDRLRTEGVGPVSAFAELIDREARRIFNATISNDPRPHYFHQSNLISAEDSGGGQAAPGMMCILLDAVLDRYHTHIAVDVGLLQPTLGEVGRLLRRRQAWHTALSAGAVRAYVDSTHVFIVNSSAAPVEVPLTGTTVGDEYASRNSGWIRVMAGETIVRRQVAPAALSPAAAPAQ